MHTCVCCVCFSVCVHAYLCICVVNLFVFHVYMCACVYLCTFLCVQNVPEISLQGGGICKFANCIEIVVTKNTEKKSSTMWASFLTQ